MKHPSDRVYDSALLFFVLIAVVLLLAPSVLAISYNPSVIFRLRTGKADITFQNAIHFSDIRVRSNAVVFDSVSFGIEKALAPNLITTITIWTPAVQSGTAIEFVGASLGTTVNIYFNISGLQSLSYDVKVNGATQATLTGPTVSFLWSNWNAQETIAFVVAVSITPPTPGGPGLPFRPSPPYDWTPLGIGFLLSALAVLVIAVLVRSGFFEKRGDIHFRSRLTDAEMRRLRAAAKVIVVKQPIHLTGQFPRPKRMRIRKYRTR